MGDKERKGFRDKGFGFCRRRSGLKYLKTLLNGHLKKDGSRNI